MVETIKWQDGAVMILDQRKLPQRTVYLRCTRMSQVIHAIQTLAVRGAPAIGIAAAMGLALAARSIRLKEPDAFRRHLAAAAQTMRAARPTAVNLAWAVDRMMRLASSLPEDTAVIKEALAAESQTMLEEDIAINRALGRHGARLVPQKASLLTHCNAGSLATGGYGTALGVVRAAKEAGKQVSVLADETRPLWQGARLTAWEMVQEHIPVKVLPDSAAGVAMAKGLVDLVVVGADRIAANGDVANKVGTSNVALQANRFKVPFYVAAPLSTIDLATKSGEEIPIEERQAAEVLQVGRRRLAPQGAQALNFAFDITPARLVSAIITEAGVHSRPYRRSLARAKAAAKH